MKKILSFVALLCFVITAHAQCIPGGISGFYNVHVGATTTYSSSGTTGGTWSSSNPSVATINATTGDITGLTQGSATITYSLTGSCTGLYATYAVTISSGIVGRTKSCIGDTTTVRNSISGGTWTSSNPSIASINSTTGVVSAITAGSVTLSYNFTVASVSYVAVSPFNVVSVPTLRTFVGPRITCAGTGPTATIDSTSVIWTSRDSSILGISAILDSSTCFPVGVSAGTTYLVYTSSYCSFVTDSVNYTVFPTPVITGSIYRTGTTSASICNGDTVTFHYSDTAARGTWLLPDHPLSTIVDSTGFFTGVSDTVLYEGSIYYQIINSFGCSNYTDYRIMVPPILLPGLDSILGPDTVNIGSVYTYTGSQFMRYGYFDGWYISSGTAASVSMFTGVLTPLHTGMITLVHEIFTDCDHVYASKNIYVTMPPSTITSTYFSSFITPSCTGPTFGINVPAHASPLQMVSRYGDGQADTATLAASTSALDTNFSHAYSCSGTYTVKQLIYSGSSAVDSISSSYTHTLCRDISLSFFHDNNGNCIFDTATERRNSTPFFVAIDSNGVTIDTISVTSGLYYRTYGVTGDIYSFRKLAIDTTLILSCPSTGVITDTLVGGAFSTNSRNVAMSCPTATSMFDLTATSSFRTGRHLGTGVILVTNSNCTPQNPVVTLYLNPRYVIDTTATYPRPTSISGSTITWNLTGIGATSLPGIITYGVDIPSSTSWFTAGDTVHTRIKVTPTAGDRDTTNNVIDRFDTVRSSYDPNHISVTPDGAVLNGTKLHFNIEFENDGNDTAQNIFVMDTLSDYLNPSTLQIAGASATMNISVIRASGHNIIKFDFPNIKLLDSSHHGRCTGNVMYAIKPYPGLSDGTSILSHAGIYFDDNEVILTNTATNTILVPHVAITSVHGDTICTGASKHFTAVGASCGTTHYQWLLNSTVVGTDSTGYTSSSLSAGDTIICKMTTIMDDTIRSVSNRMILINGGTAASAGFITGLSAVCEGATVTLSATTSGGSWSATSSRATVSGGVVTGVTAGVDTIVYSIVSSCGTATAEHEITINPLPTTATIMGTPAVCVGATTSLSATIGGGSWSVVGSNASVSGGVVTGVATGNDTIVYTTTNSCGSAHARIGITINTLPTAATITGTTTVCAGATTTFTSSASGGSWAIAGSHASVSGGVITGISGGTDTVVYTVSNSCGATATRTAITIDPLPSAATITGTTSVCVGATTTLTPSTTGGTWSVTGTHTTVSGGVVTGVTVGTDTVSYTLTNACGATVTPIVVSVITLPVAAALTGTTVVCVASTTTISSSVSGGTWSIIGSHATVAGGVVTGVSTGADTIVYTLTNSCGSTTTRATITINPLPIAGAITGTAAVCVGATITLTDTVTGGTWSVSGALATVSGGIVTGVTAGNDTVVYTVTNSCGAAYATKAIVINPLPDAGVITSVTSNVCVGSSITMIDTTTGGIWSVIGSHAAVAGGVVTGISAGIDTVVYMFTNICGTARAKAAITVNPLPNAGTITSVKDTICVGENITLNNAVAGGAWTSSNSAIAAITTTGLATGIASGTVTITYAYTNSCGTASTTFTLNVKAYCYDGVADLVGNTNNDIQVAPNPSNGYFTIALPEHKTAATLTILDLSGRTVYQQSINSIETNVQVTAENLASGVYFVQVQINGNTFRKKIVVM